MPDCDFLLIGGGIAAYGAAKRIRRADADARIVMVSADTLPPYALPPLSKEFLRGEQSESDIVYPSLEAKGPIDIVLSTAATVLDPDKHEAVLSDGRRIGFGKALLATGGAPIPLTTPGADLGGVFYLRSASDARQIATAAASASNAIVIGAGFIGLEVAASLRKLGLNVTIVEAQARVWPRFADANVAGVVQARCAAKGVEFLTGERVVGVNGDDGHVTSVTTSSGLQLDCDLVCVGIGITPNTALASAAGLEIANGVVVDATMRTSAPDIFAAGDLVSFPDPICGRRVRAEHWGHAEYSGQLAGGNMAGGDTHYDFMSYAWSDVFDLHIDTAGYIEDHDEIVVRGDLKEKSFTSLYLRGGVLVGYCAINVEPVEFTTYRKLIRSRQPLSTDLASLRDTSVNVRSLVRA